MKEGVNRKRKGRGCEYGANKGERKAGIEQGLVGSKEQEGGSGMREGRADSWEERRGGGRWEEGKGGMWRKEKRR